MINLHTHPNANRDGKVPEEFWLWSHSGKRKNAQGWAVYRTSPATNHVRIHSLSGKHARQTENAVELEQRKQMGANKVLQLIDMTNTSQRAMEFGRIDHL